VAVPTRLPFSCQMNHILAPSLYLDFILEIRGVEVMPSRWPGNCCFERFSLVGSGPCSWLSYTVAPALLGVLLADLRELTIGKEAALYIDL
jgi:hypothetical protein